MISANIPKKSLHSALDAESINLKSEFLLAQE